MVLLDAILTNPMYWIGWGAIVCTLTFLIDLLDHGIFIGVPAFLMAGIAPWVDPTIFSLLIYGIMVAAFYYFCQSHRDWLHGTKTDIND